MLLGSYYHYNNDRSVVSSNNKTDRHALTEILLKVALNTITLTLTIIILSSSNEVRPFFIII